MSGWWNRPLKKSRASYKTYTAPVRPVNPIALKKHRNFRFDAEINWWLLKDGSSFVNHVCDALEDFNRGSSYLQRNQQQEDPPLDSDWLYDYEPITVIINQKVRGTINFTISFWEKRTYSQAVSTILTQVRYYCHGVQPFKKLRGMPFIPRIIRRPPDSRRKTMTSYFPPRRH